MEDKNIEPKDMPTALDCAIRVNEKGTFNPGYNVNGIKYFNYICNDDWKEYLKKMSPSHQRQYGMGSGGELNEGRYPPKMASFGSSSRLIYELSKKERDFIFEEKLDTRVGGTANLDGFIRKGDHYIYIEAKRREIYYPSHERQEIKSVYSPVYLQIAKICKDFDFSQENSETKNGEGTKRITFKIRKKPVRYFDLKQLICHFLGIAYDIVKHSVSNVTITFLYLLYDPKNVEQDIDKKYRKKVMERYDEVVLFIKNNKDLFEKIFHAVLQYQAETHNRDVPSIKFNFKLVDQKHYQSELK